MKRTTAFAIAALAGLSTAAFAQDSVSINGAVLGGSDGLDSFSAVNQRVNYVVDLTPFTTTWGTEFAIAPLVKSSKIAPEFQNSLIRAQAMSRGVIDGTPANSYAFWTTPGAGVNVGDNLNGTPQNNPAGSVAFEGDAPKQFALAFHEVGGVGTDGESVVTALVNLDADNPTRLFVERVVTATSGNSQFFGNTLLDGFGFGSVDAHGNTAFKEGGFGFTAPQSLLVIDAENRTSGLVNAINTLSASPSTAADAGSTSFPLDQFFSAGGFEDTTNPGNIIPQSAGGPTVISSQFGSSSGTPFLPQYVSGSTREDLNAPGGLGTRGSFSTADILAVDGVSGTNSVAIMTKDLTDGPTRAFTFWNVDGAGVRQPAGSPQELYIEFPVSVQDNKYPRPTAFPVFLEHYRSQVAAQGGVSQITFGRDQAGNLLAAAYAADDEGELADRASAIVAVRRDNLGNNEFGLVAWTGERVSLFSALGTRGKPVVDSAGGNTIGFLANMETFTFEFGSAQPGDSLSDGPSLSAPSIDAAGNIWFLAPVELLETPVADPANAPALVVGEADIEIGLIRAVYDASAALPSWDLELVFRTGDVFTGQNSATDYRVGIGFFQIADGDSVSTSTFWSHNAITAPFADQDNASYDTADARNSAGVIVSGEIIYDLGPTPGIDPDPVFDFNAGDPGVPDESYQVTLYVGAATNEIGTGCVVCPNTDDKAGGAVNTGDLLAVLAAFNTGDGSTPGFDPADTNCDGFVNTGDLLQVLAVFNTTITCP